MRQKPKPIILADIIRFAAAFWVMLFHTLLQSWTSKASNVAFVSGGTYRFEWATPYVWFGWVGVQVFFVLSGFVIAYSIQDSHREFFKRRFLRIYPTAWACVALIILILASLTSMGAADLFWRGVRSAVLWPSGPWVSGVFWTLPVEIAFYVFIYITLRLRSAEFVPYAALALIPWSGAFWVLRAFGMADGVPEWLANMLLLTYGSCFALGILIWHVSSERRPLKFYAAIAVAIIVSCVSILPKSLASAQTYEQPFAIPILVFIIAVFGLIVSIRYNDNLVGWFGVKLTRQVGIMTYPLYLIHPAICGAALWLAAQVYLPASVAWIFALAAAIALSLVISFSLEPKFRRATEKLLFRNR